MTLHAEAVRERQGHRAIRVVRACHGVAHGLLGGVEVEEVALEVGHLGARQKAAVDVSRGEGVRHAEVGGHGPLGVLGHQHEAPARPRGAGRDDGSLELDADRSDVVREHIAHGIGCHLADEAGGAAERRNAGHRVGGGATRDLDARAHRGVHGLSLVKLDERHRALGQAESLEERIVDSRNDIDKR